MNFLDLQEVPTNQYFVAIEASQSFYHFHDLQICDLDDIVVTSLVLAW